VKRYGVEPVRNARANGQLAHLVGRLGEDAAAVAGYFVGHDGAHYVKLAHSVGCLLADAEKLHMEWSSGRTVPDTKVTEAKGRQPRSFAGTDYSAGVTDGHA
jgi:hypothetical protein